MALKGILQLTTYNAPSSPGVLIQRLQFIKFTELALLFEKL